LAQVYEHKRYPYVNGFSRIPTRVLQDYVQSTAVYRKGTNLVDEYEDILGVGF